MSKLEDDVEGILDWLIAKGEFKGKKQAIEMLTNLIIDSKIEELEKAHNSIDAFYLVDRIDTLRNSKLEALQQQKKDYK